MTQREKTLALLVGTLFIAIVGYFGYTWWQKQITTQTQAIAAAKTKLRDLETQQGYVNRVRSLREEWQATALPAKSPSAQNLYQNWLAEAAKTAKLRDVNIVGKSAGSSKNVFEKVTYAISGQGSLEQIGSFLYQVSSPERMQTIRLLIVEPQDKSSELKIKLDLEALLLNGATGTQLSEKNKPDYPANSVGELVKRIQERNLFAAYTPPPVIVDRPPPPPPPPVPPPFDTRAYTKLVGILLIDDRPQAWIRILPKDLKLELFEGDEFEIDKQKGQVTKIDVDKKLVEFTIGGKSLLVKLGDTLAEPRGDRVGRL
ncbi:MAG: hypothetical protein SFX18_03535 [Pirellulales bacterium]|nr:hypothetical protein [Pirellulales bacterium]